MKKTFVTFLHAGAFGLIGCGWYSETLPLKAKLMVTAVAVLMLAAGTVLMFKWDISD